MQNAESLGELSEIGRARVRQMTERVEPVIRGIMKRLVSRRVKEFEMASAPPFTDEELAWFRRPL